MSASTTQLPPRFTPTRSCSIAWCALRFGLNPWELSRKSASKTGSSTTFAAACTTRSRMAGIPNGLWRPSALGMYTRRTGCGRYRPSRSSSPSFARNPSTPPCSIVSMVAPSMPAAPALAFTSPHALSKMSSRYTLSYSAWNRRVALAFAARYSALWSSRAASTVSLATWAFTSPYPLWTHGPSAAPSLRPGYAASASSVLWAAPTPAPLSPTSRSSRL